jgi:hypothetical protein
MIKNTITAYNKSPINKGIVAFFLESMPRKITNMIIKKQLILRGSFVDFKIQ